LAFRPQAGNLYLIRFRLVLICGIKPRSQSAYRGFQFSVVAAKPAWFGIDRCRPNANSFSGPGPPVDVSEPWNTTPSAIAGPALHAPPGRHDDGRQAAHGIAVGAESIGPCAKSQSGTAGFGKLPSGAMASTLGTPPQFWQSSTV
jgi:hypothetical protein